jgi:hypothetical protein
MTRRLIVLILALIANLTPTFASPSADRCLNAPLPRLRVGIEAVVMPGIGRLNLRALPAVDTGIELQLYEGNRVTVIAGPSCNGMYNWWRVETANGRRGWVAEGTWETYYVVPARDEGRTPDPVEFTCGRRFASSHCYLP